MNLPIDPNQIDEDYLHPLVSLTLLALMRDISEEHYCASWLHGLEHSLWRIVTTDERRFGMNEVPEDRVHLLRLLSQEAGGWWVWHEDGGPRFVGAEKWAEAYAKVAT